ncbi:hypothetical protein OEZ86_006237 [Tetradesmus obliquus]|nr:hypothetical protein OEZ86_006237 [Tetradesmus obliquus]
MAPRYPMLFEVAPERKASRHRPAASPVWTNALSADGSPSLPGVSTLYDNFKNSCEKWPNSLCLGHRPVVDGEAQPYKFITYAEAQEQTASIASAFKSLGLKRGDKICILGSNCPEWMLAMQACNRMSYVCVPLYETLGADAIEYIIEHSEARMVVVAGKRLGRMAAALKAVGKLAGVAYWGEAAPADIRAARATENKLLSFAELQQLGRSKLAAPEPPKPSDLSTIMYTSGTTGTPKGVMITHAALVATIAGCNQYLASFNESLGPEDSYLSFLPLAHVFDRLAEEFMLHKGGSIGYWQGEIPKVLDDIKALRPSLFCGVPRVFDRIYAGINEQLRANVLKWLVFHLCLWRKSYFMKRGIKHDKASPLADALAFNAIKAKLGGRVRLILSGAAPLAQPTQEFLSCAMCAPVLQGYGLTETCAASSIAEPFRWDTIGTVGAPMPGVEVRLEAVPEMGYDPAAEPPTGEVCIRGPGLFSGYYKQPGLTKECIDADGFFHTGDIARLVGDGTLQVIDRKKNIFKLAQGEYIAVEKIENVLKSCPLVEQVWVYGNSFESCLVAVAVPAEKPIMAWAAGRGIRGTYQDVALHPETRAFLLSELQAAGRSGKLAGFEQVKALHTDCSQFSVDNDLMTPTFKLKRPQLQQHYQAQLDLMYQSINAAAAAKARLSKAAGL